MNKELEQIICEVEKAISGKRAVIEKILMAILSDGHILLDDVPGVGKTTLALALSRTLGLNYHRIQFTPDVLPSDIIGFSVYNKDTGAFDSAFGAFIATIPWNFYALLSLVMVLFICFTDFDFTSKSSK